ncbi:hypothetical protein DFH06DRAFT_1134706 [Mycena polygramma]|nr:hypothetical protein DFH06DRAFT_1134706 [Mycena polygramma]
MPSHLCPQLSDHLLACAHGGACFFDIDISSERFCDVYTWVNGDPNSNGTWLTNLSAEERQEMARIMVFWDTHLHGEQRLRLLGKLEECLGILDGLCEITVHLFLEPGVPALVQRVCVADRRRFRFDTMPFFALSNASGAHPTMYERYELNGDVFSAESRVLGRAGGLTRLEMPWVVQSLLGSARNALREYYAELKAHCARRFEDNAQPVNLTRIALCPMPHVIVSHQINQSLNQNHLFPKLPPSRRLCVRVAFDNVEVDFDYVRMHWPYLPRIRTNITGQSTNKRAPRTLVKARTRQESAYLKRSTGSDVVRVFLTGSESEVKREKFKNYRQSSKILERWLWAGKSKF